MTAASSAPASSLSGGGQSPGRPSAHVLKFRAGRKRRRETAMVWLATALWWQRPELLDQPLPAGAPLPRRRRWRHSQVVGGREVRMSDQMSDLPRRREPANRSQHFGDGKPRLQQSRRGWAGREVRMRRD